jgi:N-acetylmuramoyl-L-alanine amidase
MKTCSFFPVLLVAAVMLAIPVPTRAQGGLKLKTVVIDAGHGGKDAGCVSRDKKTYEKNVALDIAQRLEKKINAAFTDVDVKMTRRDDRFVELEKRAVFANRANANLFISIHVNAVEKGTQANGYSIHVLGQSQRKGNDLYSKNLDLVKRENSVIMLEDNYQTRYQGFDPNDPQSSIIFSLMQNAHLNASLGFAEDVADAMSRGPIVNSRGVSQDPFWVLWRTTMPSVLVEVGFMSNPNDLTTLRSPEGRDAIATNLFNAFWAFKTRYDRTMSTADVRGKDLQNAGAVEEKPAAEKPVVQEQQVQEEPEVKTPPVVEQKPVEKPAEKPKVEQKPVEKPKAEAKPATGDIYYGIQVAAVSKQVKPGDPFFKGYKPVEVYNGKLYKYLVCTSPSLDEVKKKFPEVKATFKDCFVVKVANGNTSVVR